MTMERRMREIIVIDEEKCDGCGDCVPSCDEGAIQIIDGKAKLVSETYCDGLGACLTECPQDALTLETQVVEEFDQAAVDVHLEQLALQELPEKTNEPQSPPPGGGCPGSATMDLRAKNRAPADDGPGRPSELRQWPIQFHLISPEAPYFQGADLMIAADCVPFALADFHRDHLQGKSIAIACPKLDAHQEIYQQKLTSLIDGAGVKSITVMIMQVPCCGGLFQMTRTAVEESSRNVPLQVKVVGIEGDILTDQAV